MDTPEAISGTGLTEGSCATKGMRNFIEVWGFIMLLKDGFVEISGVKAYVKAAIGLLEVGQGRYPVG